MNIEEALQDVNRLFLDTAPVIYYLEHHPTYFDRVGQIFGRIDSGQLTAVTSPVTLAECLVHPYRLGLNQFQPTDAAVGQQAASIRAAYNLTLPDALQRGAALTANCEAFLTNDKTLQRVTELRVIVLGNLVDRA
jgi:predicted nucleic acid-binding protein